MRACRGACVARPVRGAQLRASATASADARVFLACSDRELSAAVWCRRFGFDGDEVVDVAHELQALKTWMRPPRTDWIGGHGPRESDPAASAGVRRHPPRASIPLVVMSAGATSVVAMPAGVLDAPVPEQCLFDDDIAVVGTVDMLGVANEGLRGPGHALYLANLCVLREARGQGAGRALLAFADKTASEWGCERILTNAKE